MPAAIVLTSALIVPALVVGAFGLVMAIVLGVMIAWPWRIEATAKAMGNARAISGAGGLEVAGFSLSAAAILGGPGVVALHFRGRELWRRPLSIEALLAWLDELASKKDEPSGPLGRWLKRVGEWLVDRTDLADLPSLGFRVLDGLREVSFVGHVTCGFSDPALTGKAAAVLFPLAGILAPLGVLDVTIDWTGQTRLDGAIDLSFRVVPYRVALDGLWFARHHVHWMKSANTTATPPSSATSLGT